MTAVRRPRSDPLDCGHGCYPPHTPRHLRDHRGGQVPVRTNETWEYLPGDRWVCPHGAAYEAYDPSTRRLACTFRKWRRLRGIEAWLARRAARHNDPDRSDG